MDFPEAALLGEAAGHVSAAVAPKRGGRNSRARAPDAPPPRLSPAVLRRLPAGVRFPHFTPQALRPGILHLGCGAFHRGHQALFTHQAIESEVVPSTRFDSPRLPPWGIVATSLRTPDTVRALQQQAGLYTVLERGPHDIDVQVVGSLRQVVFVPEERTAVDAWFAHPGIRIVTLTVSAAGYCVDPTTHRLDPTHPDIRHDVRSAAPRSAVGLLVRGLAQRRRSGVPPPVVMSCDNVAANGRVLRQACIDFAALKDDMLSRWIASNVRFPSTVVDRIVPAASEQDRADAFRELGGIVDAVPVCAEPFRQWVIERFDGPRPRWEAAGAEFVADVEPWEASKLRLLNGGHLALAYPGLLAGFSTVADAIADPPMLGFVRRFLLDEQRPTLPRSDHDTRAYARQLIERWRNPSIADALLRVGRDGSAKLPARLLASWRDNLAAGRPAPRTALVIAAWMRCAAGRDDAGRELALQDPMADTLRSLGTAAASDPERLVDAFLAIVEVFGDDLPREPLVRASLVQAVAALQRHGAHAAIAACAADATA